MKRNEIIIRDPFLLQADGPYIFYDENQVMSMLWSSWGNGGYSMGVSVSPSGNILGPWEHRNETLAADGGHGMVFTFADGERLLVYHSPNEAGKEHPLFEKLQRKKTAQ